MAWSRRILIGIAVSFCAATALTGASESEPALMARALLFGFEMPPPPRSPASLAQAVTRYRDRERRLKTRLGPPPPGDVESANYSKHVGLERSLYALFDRADSAELAAAYAAPARLLYEWEGDPDAPRQEAEYAEEFLAAHPETPLAPYLHLFAGHREMCAATLEAERMSRKGREASCSPPANRRSRSSAMSLTSSGGRTGAMNSRSLTAGA